MPSSRAAQARVAALTSRVRPSSVRGVRRILSVGRLVCCASGSARASLGDTSGVRVGQSMPSAGSSQRTAPSAWGAYSAVHQTKSADSLRTQAVGEAGGTQS